MPSSKKHMRNNGLHTENPLSVRAAQFEVALPYKQAPYSSRNWGHKLHSLCSYQGKLKPAMAHWLIREFVPKKGRLIDPLGGVGTIPFEAALLGRESVSNDKSPLAATIAAAKLAPPSLEHAKTALEALWKNIEAVKTSEIDFSIASFGLNATVADYYHKDTLLEILKARKVFLQSKGHSKSDLFLWASLLHILHGNRPYALSRNSHPITPFHPKGETVYKSVREKIWGRVETALSKPLPEAFIPGEGLFGDFRELKSSKLGQFDAIITSPPFLGMRFDRPNWLRLWFCGWGEADFHTKSLGFLERQQNQSANCYVDFFEKCHELLKKTGILVIHVGSGGKKRNLAEELKELALDKFRMEAEIREDVQSVEHHGLSDKGLTTKHHLIVLTPV